MCGFLFQAETLSLERVIQKFISCISSSAHTVHNLLQETEEDPIGIRKSSVTNTSMTFDAVNLDCIYYRTKNFDVSLSMKYDLLVNHH